LSVLVGDDSGFDKASQMNPPLGFILVSHDKPKQLLRLVNKLNAMFSLPPIVCHHDFSQCVLPTELFPANVSFVRPHMRTAWADFSIVELTVRAIEQMYAAPASPDWFVLLSGTDYPIKPAAQILADFSAANFDAAILYELIRANDFKRDWQESCYHRYCTLHLRLPSVGRRRLTQRKLVITHPLLTRPFLPFGRGLDCYAGATWFSASRRAARHILEFHKSDVKLAKHYRKLMFSDESYFQTVLANDPRLKLKNENWRYTDWPGYPDSPHPKMLRLEDLSKLLASPAHFARKFDMELDSAILDELDRVV
jgi:Core-2/I-Branching enzyme